MIIPRALKVRTSDPSAYAWAGLRKFQSIELVTKRLIEIQRLPLRHHPPKTIQGMSPAFRFPPIECGGF